jgi:TRAP-type transport system small permease protein
MQLKTWTENVAQAITAFLMIGMAGLTFVQVVSRYALDTALPWTEELARLDLIYLTFFGSIVAFQRREHLRVEMVVHALPPSLRRWLTVAIDVASMAVLGVVVWQGIPLLVKFWPLLSAALQWPTTLFYFPAVFGCFVMLVYTAVDVVAALRETSEGVTNEAKAVR